MTPKAIRRGLTAAVALLIGLGLAASASAQGMYYKEIAKDGRIYVFNDAKRAEAFEKSGEMGVAHHARRLSARTARPSLPTASKPSTCSSSSTASPRRSSGRSRRRRRSSGATARRASRRTRPTSRSRTACRCASPRSFPDDDDPAPWHRTPRATARARFRIRRAKFKLEGWFYKPELTYEMQMNWPAVTGSNIGARSSRTPPSRGTSPRRGQFGSCSASSRSPSATRS